MRCLLSWHLINKLGIEMMLWYTIVRVIIFLNFLSDPGSSEEAVVSAEGCPSGVRFLG
jgi:hypothetical protein